MPPELSGGIVNVRCDWEALLPANGVYVYISGTMPVSSGAVSSLGRINRATRLEQRQYYILY